MDCGSPDLGEHGGSDPLVLLQALKPRDLVKGMPRKRRGRRRMPVQRLEFGRRFYGCPLLRA